MHQSNRIVSVLLAFAGIATIAACLHADDDAKPAAFTPLFNGTNLDGWTAKDLTRFKVEDGCLVGTQDDGKGADLFTTKDYDNFELRVTYKMKWPGNSGFWYRTNPDTMKGYQYDVLKWPNPIAFSGTLYCQDKMFLFRNVNEALENRDGWNEARAWVNGKHLIQWLNGKRIGEIDDTTYTTGRIGIQVHPGNDFKGMKITVKKIELRPVPADEKPPALTDAEKLARGK